MKRFIGLLFFMCLLGSAVCCVTKVVEEEESGSIHMMKWSTTISPPLGYRTRLKVGLQDWVDEPELYWVRARIYYDQEHDSGWKGGWPSVTVGVDHDSTLTSVHYQYDLRRGGQVLEMALGNHYIKLP